MATRVSRPDGAVLYRCPDPPSGCGQEKPATEFYPAEHHSHGLSHRCKECARERARETRKLTAQLRQ